MKFLMKFCNHCGRLYDGTRCSCRRDNTKKLYHKSFYDSPAWRKLANYIRVRDYNMDRLSLFLSKKGLKEEGVYKLLHDYLIDAYGEIRRHSGAIVVHHIVPREENYSMQYDVDNLISLNTHVHEYVHQLYGTKHKEEVQNILREAVHETLP